jgi:hypothetical protein
MVEETYVYHRESRPLGHIGIAEEIADAALFPAYDESSFVIWVLTILVLNCTIW